MKKLFTAVILLAMTTMPANAQQHLIINELMQSNVECLFDDQTKEFPDSWVELYNPTSEAISLGSYKIGTKNKENKAWQLPTQDVPAGGYVVIYCDKEGLEDNRLHTDFRLESGDGCVVYLFDKNTKEIVDSLPYINDKPLCKMPAPDVAFGRAEDGGGAWGYQATPTPGASNCNKLCTDLLGAPVFSHKGRVDNTAFNLTLSLPQGAPAGTVICYTTNGREPKGKFEITDGLEPRFVPTDSSMLYNNTPIDITTTKVVRAKLFCYGWLSPVSTAQSYIFHPRSMTVPIISIQTNYRYLNSNDIGIFTNNTSKENKVDWRRPINIEMFKAADEPSVINQLGETRIMGGQSRANALKSMAIYANKRFDPDPNKKRFDYQFFPDQKPGIDRFKSFALRDGGNDFEDLYFRDLIIQRTMGQNTDMDWQAGHTAVLYINGVYMGMLNIRERSNADYIYSNYNGLEDIDMIEIGHEKVNNQDQYIEELKEGTKEENYNDFKTFYSEQGHTMAEYEQWMDVGEYLNIVIMNLFYANLDFPGNNIVFWRPNNKDKDSGLPKRWRFIAKDTDFGLGLYSRKPNHNTIDMLYNPRKYSDNWAFTEPATRLIKNMLVNEDIRNLFIDKCCVFMGDFMNAEGTGAVINDIKAEAMEEFVAHRIKYNKNNHTEEYNRTDITNKFNNAKRWLTGGYTEYDWTTRQYITYSSRTDYFLQYMSSQWTLGDAIPVTINKNVDATELPDEVLVNGIKLTNGVFDGKLFQGRMITLEGNTKFENNKIVKGWEIKITYNGSVTTDYPEGSTYTFPVPECTSLQIKAIMDDAPMLAISQYGAVSFSSTYPLDFTDQQVQAYIVTEDKGSSFAKQQVYKVPAKTGLVVEGAEGTYKIPIAKTTSFDDVSSNMLLSTATAAFTVPNDGSYYGLFYSTDTNQLGFKKRPAGEVFDIGKSYLDLTGKLAREFSEIFFNDATAIPRVDNNTWTDGKAYNLNGQRVEKNYKGVMIVNGKKVFNNPK